MNGDKIQDNHLTQIYCKLCSCHHSSILTSDQAVHIREEIDLKIAQDHERRILLNKLVIGSIRSACNSHPEISIPPNLLTSLSNRVVGQILAEWDKLQ